jgi:hypothetical protein
MSTNYAKAPSEISERISRLIASFHPELNLNSVRIDCISAVNTDEEEPAIKLHGAAGVAVVKVLDSKQRAMGRGDAEIVVDELRYYEMSEAEQDALLDHELFHLEIKLNRHGRPKVDEHGRPKLKLKLHDRQFGWFDAIAQRHGAASMECKQATRFVLSGKQLYFGFAMTRDLGAGVKATVNLLPEAKPAAPKTKVAKKK